MAAIDSGYSREVRERRSASDVALSLVQIAIGYEWLVSGLSKIANGNFARGLAAELGGFGRTAPSWYGHFLRAAVVPHAVAFGYLIDFAELAVGVVLVGVALTDLATGPRVSRRLIWLLRRVAIAALVVGIVMATNFELANGGGFGLHLAADSFDEGVDLDTIMVAAQVALLVAFAPADR